VRRACSRRCCGIVERIDLYDRSARERRQRERRQREHRRRLVFGSGNRMTIQGNAAHDGRLDAGMAGQASALSAAVAAGARQVGWKAGFGTSVWRTTFGLDAPLIGFLLDATRRDPESDGSTTVSVGGWRDPRAEAEIAVRLARDVPGDAGPERALAAIGASAPAIEIVDIDPEPTEPEQILRGNVYHRWWCTGAFRSAWSGSDLAALTGRVATTAEAAVDIADCQALTGAAGDILSEVARMAARHGRGLLAGDVVILGSILPPMPVAAGEHFGFSLADAPTITVHFTD